MWTCKLDINAVNAIAHWFVVARLNDDIIIFFDIDKNLQGLKMRVCAKFGGSKSVWGHT